jgi:hypothetical protein
LSALAAQKRPEPTFSGIFSVPIPAPPVVHFAVAVVVVAVKTVAVRCLNADYIVNHFDGISDNRIVRRFYP